MATQKKKNVAESFFGSYTIEKKLKKRKTKKKKEIKSRKSKKAKSNAVKITEIVLGNQRTE